MNRAYSDRDLCEITVTIVCFAVKKQTICIFLCYIWILNSENQRIFT